MRSKDGWLVKWKIHDAGEPVKFVHSLAWSVCLRHANKKYCFFFNTLLYFLILKQTNGDGNITYSTLKFTPTIDDSGKFLVCRGEQPLIQDSGTEKGWTLDIHRKYMNSHFSIISYVKQDFLTRASSMHGSHLTTAGGIKGRQKKNRVMRA